MTTEKTRERLEYLEESLEDLNYLIQLMSPVLINLVKSNRVEALDPADKREMINILLSLEDETD